MNINKFDSEVGIVMCSWNSPELLQKCIPNIKKNASLDVKIYVALNGDCEHSKEILKREDVDYIVCNDNYGTLSVCLLNSFLKCRYAMWINDDMLFSKSFDKDLVDIINSEKWPATASNRLVERQVVDGNIVLQDLELPEWFDDNAYDIFQKNVDEGRYRCNRISGYFHPIMVNAKDWLKVATFDLKYWPGHSYDDAIPARLKHICEDYRFILSNSSFCFHGSSITNKKLKRQDPSADARSNIEVFQQEFSMSRGEFKRKILEGSII